MTQPKKSPPIYVPKILTDLLNGPTDIDWIIDGIIPPQSSGLIVGDGGTGKTWLALDLALAVATGTAWMGEFEARQGTVLVVDEENAELMLRERLYMLLEGRGLKHDNVGVYFLVGEGVNLSPHERRGQFEPSESYIKLYNTIMALKPSLVILDSLTRVHTSNENAASEMATLFSFVKRLIRDTDTNCFFPHHMNKGQGSSKSGHRIRGSSDLRNFADYTLLIDKEKDLLTIEHDKARWSEPIPTFKVRLKVTDTSAVLLYEGKAPKMTVVQFIKDYLEKHGKATFNDMKQVVEKLGICKSDKLRKELRWCEKEKIIVASNTRPKIYKLPDAFDQAMF
jgi:RecA-family ATPase